MDTLSLFCCFETLLTPPTVRQLTIIIEALLSMTGRITMLSLARWTGPGGSYRTLNRFFAADLPWVELLITFFRTHLFNAEHEYILAGDETVIGKAGEKTFGVDRFYSGLKGKVINGLSLFVFSVVDVNERQASPVSVTQTVRSAEEKAAAAELRKKKPVKKKKKKAGKAKSVEKKKRGRPKGSRNQDKTKFDPSSELARIDEWLKELSKQLGPFVTVKHLALDGHFGHNQAVLMAGRHDLHLISKLRKDSALHELPEDEESRRGAPTKYGAKLVVGQLPDKYLKETVREQGGETKYYQGVFVNKNFAAPLNVVMIEKYDRESGKAATAILFSSDLELGWKKLIEYYRLRFQIEFNFREAKQHFGLEDFMQTTAKGVKNAANLAFMGVNVSAKLLKEGAGQGGGVLDLKAHFRGVKYVVEVIKILREKPEMILKKEGFEELKKKIGQLGRIHQKKADVSTS
jgi:putative transposase